MAKLTASFEDLTRSLGTIRQCERDNLVESRELDIVQNDQRTVDAANGVVADARLDVHHPGVDGEILSGYVSCGGRVYLRRGKDKAKKGDVKWCTASSWVVELSSASYGERR